MTNSTGATGLTAIVAMLVATLCYLLGDTAAKLASETIAVPQIIAVRGLIMVFLVVLTAAASGALRHWPRMFSPRVFIRGVLDVATTLMFTYALANMRIADATAIINAAPIAATLMAIFFLKERVGVARWTAIIVGFAGVLLVLQPDASGFNIYGLLAIGAMITVAGREVITRRIAADIPSLIVTLWSALAVAISGTVLSLANDVWQPMEPSELGLLAAAALLLFGAYHFGVVALRLGEVSLVGPVRYVIIVWGLVMGFVVWGDIPGLAALSGMVLIAFAGLTVIRREYMHSRRDR